MGYLSFGFVAHNHCLQQGLTVSEYFHLQIDIRFIFKKIAFHSLFSPPPPLQTLCIHGIELISVLLDSSLIVSWLCVTTINILQLQGVIFVWKGQCKPLLPGGAQIFTL